MFLKPFTYPLPETRFLHAGRSVYKLKIRYGNFLCDDIDNNENTAKELEVAIRVIIGNLDNLHPFATERLTIFPYILYSVKWERVSKLRFKHGDTFLAPYPHVCTMYVELNSFQQSIFVGKFVRLSRSLHTSPPYSDSCPSLDPPPASEPVGPSLEPQPAPQTLHPQPHSRAHTPTWSPLPQCELLISSPMPESAPPAGALTPSHTPTPNFVSIHGPPYNFHTQMRPSDQKVCPPLLYWLESNSKRLLSPRLCQFISFSM
uniref:Uncharacterized protein n=1 Tax=Chelonoidis abingdonii TaxID=106734 RepID=A0A8C0JAL4_CHEAB